MEKSNYLMMTDAQIISEATAIPYGIVNSIIKNISNDYTILSRMDDNMLKEYKMTPVMIKRFNAIMNSHTRVRGIINNKPFLRRINTSKDVRDMLEHIGEYSEEHFYLLILNRAHKVTKVIEHSKGGLAGTVMDITLLGKQILSHMASGIITVHNHPSGNVRPSDTDTRIAEKIKKMCEIIGVVYLDNMIISGDGYFSYADEGMI